MGEAGRRKRGGFESNDVFADRQPQYPDLQGFFYIDLKVEQEIFSLLTTHTLATRLLKKSLKISAMAQFEFAIWMSVWVSPYRQIKHFPLAFCQCRKNYRHCTILIIPSAPPH
ncbi:MAG TPA: hypothetical protein VGJ73_21060 [Verrucomicrobiae bacterium]|jgi:hypothetical protein